MSERSDAAAENSERLDSTNRSSGTGQDLPHDAGPLADSDAAPKSSTTETLRLPARAAATVADQPVTIGRYQVVALLGRGAFGEVYQAFDPQLERMVAIKILRREHAGDQRMNGLQASEAHVLAQLRHPGIVSVYDVVTDADGGLQIISEFVPGMTLAKRLTTDRLSHHSVAALMAKAATAVHHAHTKGFIHRDLKPANILLDEQGLPHVADFGLALHETEQQEREGELSGTLQYMSPEQMRQETHRLDGRTDIWSLGVILYELLTGRRPFVAPTVRQLCDEILLRDPKPLRQIDPKIPAELERICLKCLAKQPQDRYPVAEDLAKELRDFKRVDKRVEAARPSKKIALRLGCGGVSLSLICTVSMLLCAVVLFSVNRPNSIVKHLAPEPMPAGDDSAVENPKIISNVQQLESAIYVVMLDDTRTNRSDRFGMATAISKRELVTSAYSVALYLNRAREYDRVPKVQGLDADQSFEIIDFKFYPDFADLVFEMESLQAELRSRINEVDEIEKSDDAALKNELTKLNAEIQQIDGKLQQIVPLIGGRDLAVLVVDRDLPSWLPTASSLPSVGPGLPVRLVGFPWAASQSLYHPEGKPQVRSVSSQLFSKHQFPNVKPYFWLVRFGDITKSTTGEQLADIWSGSPVVDDKNRLIGVYSRPHPNANLMGFDPEIHEITSIDALEDIK